MICLFVLFVYLCFCFYLFIYFRAEATSVGLCVGDQHETNNFGAIQGWCLFRLASFQGPSFDLLPPEGLCKPEEPS